MKNMKGLVCMQVENIIIANLGLSIQQKGVLEQQKKR